MRITGGDARSIPIKCPKGSLVRPATDRMREAVFSSLGSKVHGATFLDLFAGTGSYGLEAISRGAGNGVFVENNRVAVTCIKQNLSMVQKSLGSSQNSSSHFVQFQDVFKWLDGNTNNAKGEHYGMVFIDPPYRDVDAKGIQLLERLIPLLHPVDGAYIVFESPHLLEHFPEGYECIRTYGKGREDTRCMLLHWSPNES